MWPLVLWREAEGLLTQDRRTSVGEVAVAAVCPGPTVAHEKAFEAHQAGVPPVHSSRNGDHL